MENKYKTRIEELEKGLKYHLEVCKPPKDLAWVAEWIFANFTPKDECRESTEAFEDIAKILDAEHGEYKDTLLDKVWKSVISRGYLPETYDAIRISGYCSGLMIAKDRVKAYLHQEGNKE